VLTQTFPLACAAAISELEADGVAVFFAALEDAGLLAGAGVEAGAGAGALAAGALAVVFVAGAAGAAAEAGAAAGVLDALVSALFDFLLLFFVVEAVLSVPVVLLAGALLSSVADFLLFLEDFVVEEVSLPAAVLSSAEAEDFLLFEDFDDLLADVSLPAAVWSSEDAVLFFFFDDDLLDGDLVDEVSLPALLSSAEDVSFFVDFFDFFLVVVSVLEVSLLLDCAAATVGVIVTANTNPKTANHTMSFFWKFISSSLSGTSVPYGTDSLAWKPVSMDECSAETPA
jgi:hypothetical protein